MFHVKTPPLLKFKSFIGAEINTALTDLGLLRIRVFHDFPYLYEGDLAHEKEYLKTYAHSEKAFVFAAYHGEMMVGATTCIPLADETPDVQQPFLKNELDIEKIFYFGESILLPAYRGMGLGHRFFEEREAHVRSYQTFQSTCFCSVHPGGNHPAQPAGYRPHDVFWTKRGYQKDTSLQCQMEWLDVGMDVPTSKKLIFRKKDLNQ